MHQSIPEVPIPPPLRANPRALPFLFKTLGKFPGVGCISCLNAPGWGRRKRANAPPLGLSPSNTSAVFLLPSEQNGQLFGILMQWYKRLQGQQYVLVYISDSAVHFKQNFYNF